MKQLLTLSCLLLTLLLFAMLGISRGDFASAQAKPAPRAQPNYMSQADVAERLQSAPVMFIENVGQFDEDARFKVSGGTHEMWLASDALWITLLEAPDENEPTNPQTHQPTNPPSHHPTNHPTKGVNLKLSFVNANPQPEIEPFNLLETKMNYFLGNDADKWREDVPVYGGVRYKDIYPGIDLELLSENGHPVQRLVASPRKRGAESASLDEVQLHVEGAEELQLLPSPSVGSWAGGEGMGFTAKTAIGDVSLPLFTLVTPDGTSLDSPRAPTLNDNDIFAPFAPANQEPLARVPDSTLAYSTFIGGSSHECFEPLGVYCSLALDSAGNVVVTGYTFSSDFPTTVGSYDTTHNGDFDTFVLKLSEAGDALLVSTFIGGSAHDYGRSLAIDNAGNVVVTGYTGSEDFPTTPGSYNTTCDHDIFVFKLNSAGNALSYSTCIGGTIYDISNSLALDSAGNAVVTGDTSSEDFPTTIGSYDTTYNNGGQDAFVFKLNSEGDALIYSTFIGGTSGDGGSSLALDSAGNVVVIGGTGSDDFPTTAGSYDTTCDGGSGFVLKLSSAGNALDYSTCIDDSSFGGSSLALDSVGNVVVTGDTYSEDFPTTIGSYDTTYNGNGDTFVLKLNAAGDALIYSTFIGGSGWDWGRSLALDSTGNVVVIGKTWSEDFPTTAGSYDTSYNGGVSDIFVLQLSSMGDTLLYSTFIGGSSEDEGSSLALDSAGNPVITGRTASKDFPTTAGSYDTTYNGGYEDIFVLKFDTLENLPTPTPTETPTSTSTHTPTPTPTETLTNTPTETHTPTETPTSTPTFTLTPISSNTPTMTATHTQGPSSTATDTPTMTATYTPSPTATHTTHTSTPISTVTATPKPNFTPTATSPPICGTLIYASVYSGDLTFPINVLFSDSSGTFYNLKPDIGDLEIGSSYCFYEPIIEPLIPAVDTVQGYHITEEITDWSHVEPSGTPPRTPTPTPMPTTVAILVHGWQGPSGDSGPYRYRCSDWDNGPLQYPAHPTDFGNLAEFLHSNGYQVYLARWTTGWKGTIAIEQAAGCLHDQIQQVKGATGIDEITLIAHSMGGLVSRAYIEGSFYKDDVNQFITFGTPHVGVNIGVLVKWLGGLGSDVFCTVHPGTCQLSTEDVLRFNLLHQPRDTIRYDFVGGDGGPWWSPFTEGPNDGIVGRHSATGFLVVSGNQLSRWRTGESHNSMFGSPHYFNGNESLSCLQLFLSNGNSGSCESFWGMIAREQSGEFSIPSYTPTISGTLAGGESRTFSILLDGTESQLLLSWTRGDFDFTLQTPDGTVITPANVDQLSEGRYFEQTNSDWLPMAAYGMESPPVGEWQATITATNVLTETNFVLFGTLLSPITMEVEKPSSVAGGEDFTLTAHLANDGIAVSGADVQASLIGPTGYTNAMLSESTSGLYTTQMAAPTEAGQYQLIVRASGNSFARQHDLLLTVRPSDIQPSGSVTVQAIDANSNGFYEALQANVPLIVNHAGSYVANATLRAPNGDEITSSRVEATWNTGSQTLTIEFEGETIATAGIDGPYTIDLEVVSADSLQLVLDEKPLVQTKAYTANQFESGPSSTPTPTPTATPGNNSSDSLYLPLITR